MTRKELFANLEAGKTMRELFRFTNGQGCEIYKADQFTLGEHIVYIPDTDLNDIPVDNPLTESEEIRRVAGLCYTGSDFMECCGGNMERALRLFEYCDWQHPSSALPELGDDEEIPSPAQTCEMELPNGIKLRASAHCDSEYPSIVINRLDVGGKLEMLCFVEYNPEKEPGHELCVGVYRASQDEPVYYDSYEPNHM